MERGFFFDKKILSFKEADEKYQHFSKDQLDKLK